MATRTLSITDPLYDYLVAVSLREPQPMKNLRDVTYTMEARECQSPPDQNQFMGLLAKLIGAKRALEIGVFTGYSTMAIALALPEDGQLIACDVSEEWTAVGRPFWEEAGVSHKIDLRLAPAMDTLTELVKDRSQHESFDLAFIDADKLNYDNYYELCMQLIRPGGVIALDNMLWNGMVSDPAYQDEHTNFIRAMNKKLHRDERVDVSLLSIGDGLTLARKR
jgi:predicted O-methyltransferase YrrM